MANKTIVVAVDYGLNLYCSNLSSAGITVLETAIDFLNQCDGDRVLAYCVADLRDRGMAPEDSALWKWKRLKRLDSLTKRMAVPAKTSIDEAQNIRDALAEKGWEAEKVIIFCDRWHDRRLRFVWSHVFPRSEIETRPIHCRWGHDYACTYMRSELRWVLHNIAGLLAMKCFGLNSVAEIRRRGG